MAEKQRGDRFNLGKTKWGLVPFEALGPMVDVLEFGAKKYAPYNWMKGISYVETCESLLRHTHSFMSGEDNDQESGLPHVGHMLCNCLFLSWMSLHRKDMDDRVDLKQFYDRGN